MSKKRKCFIIKNIICWLLIICFTFPCFALQYTSGDAFVTKAEFDSEIEKFNSKLTAFEAGINSKIDNQVTTYLDRNGIWASTQQTINNTSKSMSCISGYSMNSSNANYGGDEKWGPYSYIDKINKTGLLFGSFNWSNKSKVASSSAKFGWNGYMYQTDGSNWRSDLGLFFLVNIYEKISGVSEKKYSGVLFRAVGAVEDPHYGDTTVRRNYILAATLPSQSVINQFQFFVTKNSQIIWEPELIYHFGCTNTANPLTGDDSTLYIEMMSASVY